MGYDISSSIHRAPISLHDYLVDGEIDVHHHWMYKRRQRKKRKESDLMNFIIGKKRKRSSKELNTPKEDRYRSVKKHKLLYRDDNGNLQEFKTSHTLYFLLYVNQEPRNTRQHKKNCSRFRMPHTSYLELDCDLSNHKMLKQWVSKDATNKQYSDIKVLLLGSLRYLGQG